MLLSPPLQTTLQAVAQRIIPADDYPGAWEAGVGLYLERQFQGDLSDSVAIYEDGLTALNSEAEMLFGHAFAALSEAQQDALLAKVEVGEVQTSWNVSPARFFFMVTQHVAEGYYGPPEHGGNSQGSSWAMLGFEERCEAHDAV
jgi:hypothetical protein